MRRTKLLPSLLLCAPLAFASCGGGETNANGVAAVTPAPSPAATAQANPATDKFYIATELRAESQEGITPGKPVYPPGASRRLGFAEKPLSLYEGSIVIKLPLRAKLRVQPCNDEACLPPREIDAPIPVTIN